MSYNVYVYYRVGAQVAEELRRRLVTMQQGIAERSGITGTLLVGADEPLLWMETYEAVEDRAAFLSLLHQEADACGVAALLPPEARHLEIFSIGSEELTPAKTLPR